MLSRIAESLFWIGRYVERAEDTARILDVQTQLILEDATIDEEATCRGLLSIMGVDDADAESQRVDMASMLDLLCYDVESPESIASALANARESARRARETLSVPMWEAINTTYRALGSGQFHAQRAPGVFRWVRERAALINGTADATTTRDEGWHFLMLGRCVERADMTSRLVATAANAGTGAPWTSTLRACGAYEAFLRTYRGLETERGAAEFLLLDRLFPRSVVFALNRAEQSLANVEATGSRAGFQTEAVRLLGRMRAELEYRSLSDLMADLPQEMERLQVTCAMATEAVTRRYFAGAEAMAWQGIQG